MRLGCELKERNIDPNDLITSLNSNKNYNTLKASKNENNNFDNYSTDNYENIVNLEEFFRSVELE